ncbi:MAG: hypothetical protein ABW250_17430 [Pyrinomonadaceae bacterium]
MPIEELDYHGRKIVVNTEGDETSLTIDGEPIPFRHDPGTGKFFAILHSPFLQYPSLLALAKGVVDTVINLRRE